MNKDRSIKMLDALNRLHNGRIAVYNTALKQIKDNGMKSLFTGSIATSRKCSQELAEQIVILGAKPTGESNLESHLLQAWMSVKSTVLAENRMAILKSCHDEENRLATAYADMLENHPGEFSDYQRYMVTAQYRLIKSSRQLIHNLVMQRPAEAHPL